MSSRLYNATTQRGLRIESNVTPDGAIRLAFRRKGKDAIVTIDPAEIPEIIDVLESAYYLTTNRVLIR